MRQCKDKGHISHPQEKPQSTSTGGRGEGGQDGYITLGGGGAGGGLPNLDHIYSAPATKSENLTTTCLNYYLTELLPDGTVALLSDYLTELLIEYQ